MLFLFVESGALLYSTIVSSAITSAGSASTSASSASTSDSSYNTGFQYQLFLLCETSKSKNVAVSSFFKEDFASKKTPTARFEPATF